MYGVICAVAGTKNSYQKATAPHPPAHVQGFSNMGRQRFDASAADSASVVSPVTAGTDLFTQHDREQSKTVDLNACSPVSDVQSPEGLGAVMVEHVRRKTGLSHSKSQLAVATVLNLLAQQVPTTEKLITTILDDVQHHHVCMSVCSSSSSDTVILHWLSHSNCILCIFYFSERLTLSASRIGTHAILHKKRVCI